MRTPQLSLACVLVGLVGVASARAQERGPVPAPGMVGTGISFGASIPTDDRLKSGLDAAGAIEGYLSRRVSIRGQVGASWQDFQGEHFSGTLKPLFAAANLVYNWEGGALHPFVTGGAGVYRFNYEENGIKGHDTAPGLNLGGGIEYFVNLHTTFTGEVLYHHTGKVITALAPFDNADFWTIGIGLKKYF
jgi:opacity protein-like surface antigen